MWFRGKFISDRCPSLSASLPIATAVAVAMCALVLGCVNASSTSGGFEITPTEAVGPTVDASVAVAGTALTRPSDQSASTAVVAPRQSSTPEPSNGDGNNLNLDRVASIFRYDIGSRALVVPDPVLDRRDNGFLFAEVYSGLVRPSLADDSRVEPDLAVSHDANSDGLTYTFKLREDARFSDGTSLTSRDVKWSWERALLPENDSFRATLVLGEISGAAEIASGDASELTGFQIVDDSTFTVQLTRPNADFLWLLADPVASVLKEANVNRWPSRLEWTSSDELPVGSGPFRLVALDNFVGKAVLEPNPYYWDVAPSLDAVEYMNMALSPLPDFNRAWEEGLVDNEYRGDASCEDDGTTDYVTIDGIRSQLTSSATAPRLTYLAFNTAVAPYDDVNFRRALVAAATVELPEILWLEEPEHRASGLLPPGFPGHDESAQVREQSRELALSALADSAYADGTGSFDLHMMPELYWPLEDQFDRIAVNWRDWLGLQVTYTDLPYALREDEFDLQLKRGTLQMRYMNLRPRYPSPHAILGAIPGLFGPNARSQETQELQRMLDNAAAEQDAVRRLTMYQEIEDHIVDRALVLPMFWNSGGSCYRVQDWVTEFRVPKWGGSLFSNVVIDSEHPAYPNRTVGN